MNRIRQSAYIAADASIGLLKNAILWFCE